MKKFFVFAAFALAAAVSCTKEIAPQQESQAVPAGFKELTLRAVCDVESKASLDGVKVVWEVGEEVAVYADDASKAQKFIVVAVDGSSVVISGTVPEGAASFTAVYPYAAAKGNNSGDVTVSVSGEQNVGASVLDSEALASVAYFESAEAQGKFCNAVALLKFTVGVDGVKKVKFSPDNSGKLSGNELVSKDGESLVIDAGKLKGESVVVSCEGGFAKNTPYYAAVIPSAYDGFYASCYTPDGIKLRISANTGTFARNAIVDMGNVSDGAPMVDGIRNAEDLTTFLDNASRYEETDVVKVLNDIDLTDVVISQALSFKGTLDGQNYSFKNWTSDGHSSLIRALWGKIVNLKIDQSCNFSLQNTYSCYVCDTVKYTGSLEGIVNNATAQKFTDQISGLHFGYLCRISYGQMKDCINNGDINIDIPAATGNIWVGGLAAFFNSGTADREKAGLPIEGVVNCKNTGDIDIQIEGTSKHIYLGGVVGGTTAAAYASKSNRGVLDGCVNEGSISYKISTNGDGTYANVGGVTGFVFGSIKNCTNRGAVSYENAYDDVNTTRPAVGGVAACVLYSVEGCKNYGDVSITGTFGAAGSLAQGAGIHTNPSFGGVVGQAGCNTNADADEAGAYFKDCENHGKLVAKINMKDSNKTNNFAGGVVGFTCAPVSGCLNDGAVDVVTKSYSPYVAGVVGKLFNSAEDCTNKGNVVLDVVLTSASEANRSLSNSFAGGVVGDQNQAGFLLKGLVNTGNVEMKGGFGSVLRYTAGCVGRCNAKLSEISGCTNSGSIKAATSAANRVGGIGGMLNTLVLKDCHNTGNIEAVMNDAQASSGGFSGFITCGGEGIEVSGNSTAGTVSASGAQGYSALFCGGIGNTSQTWDDCSVAGALTAAETIGAGYLLGGTINIKDNSSYVTNVGTVKPFKIANDASINGVTISAGDIPDKMAGYINPVYTINWNVEL
ncbi:MAG: hypothetical protein J6Y45_00330 [Bacteroidales bacterium]|nr:hypothetical protein [Bacteroidales bacterium]